MVLVTMVGIVKLTCIPFRAIVINFGLLVSSAICRGIKHVARKS